MSTPITLITGVPRGSSPSSSAPPARLEINQLIKDRVQFSLFIQALDRMQKVSQDTSTSYFGISGIHGYPPVDWENSTGGQQPIGSFEGFCTHGSILFPTWHRPYLALFEQTLVKHAIDITEESNMEQRWKDAALSLRLPFWDWGVKSVPPPEVVDNQSISILMPDGSNKSVRNPLFNYRFDPVDQSFGDPYTTWGTTVRNPTRRGGDGTPDLRGMKRGLSANHASYTNTVYNLFARVRDWNAFSNHTRGDGGSGTSSLEAVHDVIHGTISGHMGDPYVAAFDPIFWLHHCNVDRLAALWQAVRPNVWMTEVDTESDVPGTFTLQDGGIVSSSTPLTPFWKEEDRSFHNSNDVREHQIFNSTYPEFIGLRSTDPAGIRSEIAAKITQLYGQPTFSGLATVGGTGLTRSFAAMSGGAVAAMPATADQKVFMDLHSSPSGNTHANPTANLRSSPSGNTHTNPTGNPHSNPIGNPHSNPSSGKEQIVIGSLAGGDSVTGGTGSEMYDWSARVQVEKYAIDASFSICVFLLTPDGKPEEISNSDSAAWYASPYYAGEVTSFVNHVGHDKCANCVKQFKDKTIIEGFVPLNPAIAKNSNLGSLKPDAVHDYLKNNLVWKVKKVDGGQVVNMNSLPSLEVSVFSSAVSFENQDDPFPTYQPAHQHPAITAGQLGGCKE